MVAFNQLIINQIKKCYSSQEKKLVQQTTLLDWATFTYQLEFPYDYFTRKQWIERLNQQLIPLFGFGITRPQEKGFLGYTDSFVLGNHWGMVATGGASQGVLE